MFMHNAFIYSLKQTQIPRFATISPLQHLNLKQQPPNYWLINFQEINSTNFGHVGKKLESSSQAHNVVWD